MKKNTRRKSGMLTIAMCALAGCVLGGTLAWLTDTTEPVTNTFTASEIEITLEETTGSDYQMIPGWTIEKDPVVTVKDGSEDCWLFMKVEESTNLKEYITYEIDPNNWTALEGETGVYYCKITDITQDQKIKVLGYTDSENEFHPNEVLVNDDVTKEMMDKIDDASEDKPTLRFTAYAVQLWKTNQPADGATAEEIAAAQFTPKKAWEQAEELD